jgi:hypothetical protein
VLSIVACATVCAPALGAPDAPAAVVTGKAQDGARYRLDGKRLVVRLRASARVAKVTCGDLAGTAPNRRATPIWADVVTASVHARRPARRFVVRFARDVSARASLCFVGPGVKHRARMRLRSGVSTGCRPGPYESTQLSVGAVDILIASRGGFAMRACRPGDARPTRLFSDVAGRVHISTGPFVVSGDVVGWHVYRETRAGRPLATVGAVNLATGRRIGTIHPQIRASAIAVSEAGVLACIQRASWDDNAPAAVLARRPNGQIVTLDSSPGNGLSDLRVSGTTVSWLHDGQPRSASVG